MQVLDHDVSVLQPRRKAHMILSLAVWQKVIGSIVVQCHSFCQFIPHPTWFYMPDPKCKKCDTPVISILHTKESYTSRRTVQIKSCSLYRYLHTSFLSFMVQIYSFALGCQRHTLFSYIRVRSHGTQQGPLVYNHTKHCHCHCQSGSCFKLLC